MELESVVNIIADRFNPYSIFLYGSKATNTGNTFSDYEIGVIFEDEKYVERQAINVHINDNKYAIFPFRLSEIMAYRIDTPFQREIYLNVLIKGGSKTLYGNVVIENLVPPEITKENILADINFNLGMALSAVKVYKANNKELANELLYKSCLYATRDYIYYKFEKLCITYKEIYEYAVGLNEFNMFKELLETAYNLRYEKNNIIEEMYYYKNISYINKFLLIEIEH